MTDASDKIVARPGRTRCIVHIGMHKTGSTSIQAALARLKDKRFAYPLFLGSANHSLAIYSLFSANPARHHLHRVADRDRDAVHAYNDTVRATLERAIAAAAGKTLIISGEDIGLLLVRDLVKLRDFFRTRDCDLTIVGYVRPPAGFITSSFQQRVKSGSVRAFDLSTMYRNYKSSFDKFDRVFGRKHVELWKYDPSTFPAGDAVHDFFERLDILLPKKPVAPLNESLSAQAVAALYTFNKLVAKGGSTKLRGREGMGLGQMLPGEKFRFAPDLLRSFLTKYRADIDWMEQRLGQPLDENLGETRPTDVRNEADLLRPDPVVAATLLRRLGRAAPRGVTGKTPDEVAQLIDALRRRKSPLDVARRLLGRKG